MPAYFCTSPDVNKANKKIGKARGRRRWSLFLFGGFLVVFFAYIIQINMLAATGFEIKSLEKEAKRLEDISEELELKAAGLKELPLDKESAAGSGYIAVDKTEYIGKAETAGGIAIRP